MDSNNILFTLPIRALIFEHQQRRILLLEDTPNALLKAEQKEHRETGALIDNYLEKELDAAGRLALEKKISEYVTRWYHLLLEHREPPISLRKLQVGIAEGRSPKDILDEFRKFGVPFFEFELDTHKELLQYNAMESMMQSADPLPEVSDELIERLLQRSRVLQKEAALLISKPSGVGANLLLSRARWPPR